MNKSVILSVNDNPDYLYFAPICAWAWKQFGWNPKIIFTGQSSELEFWVMDEAMKQGAQISNLGPHDMNFRSDTMTQVSRLHGYFMALEDFIILGDIDMIPLSDIWSRNYNQMNVYGWDLTGKGDIPMCYVAGPAGMFKDIFGNGESNIREATIKDMSMYGMASSKVFEEYWYTDQKILTEKLSNYGHDKIKFFGRGQYPNGFAKGRVDRGRWSTEHEVYIDAHLMRNAYKNEKAELLNNALYHLIFKNKADWIDEYTYQYRQRYEDRYGKIPPRNI